MRKVIPVFFALMIVLTTLGSIAVAKKQPTSDDAVAAITKLENDAVKADLAGDSSFYVKNLVDNWTGGFSGGTWSTKESMLADMKDTANNKMNSEEISDLKVRIYSDNTAVATYTTTYDALIRGERRAKTVLSTDTFIRQNGEWKQVADHSSVAAAK